MPLGHVGMNDSKPSKTFHAGITSVALGANAKRSLRHVARDAPHVRTLVDAAPPAVAAIAATATGGGTPQLAGGCAPQAAGAAALRCKSLLLLWLQLQGLRVSGAGQGSRPWASLRVGLQNDWQG